MKKVWKVIKAILVGAVGLIGLVLMFGGKGKGKRNKLIKEAIKKSEEDEKVIDEKIARTEKEKAEIANRIKDREAKIKKLESELDKNPDIEDKSAAEALEYLRKFLNE